MKRKVTYFASLLMAILMVGTTPFSAKAESLVPSTVSSSSTLEVDDLLTKAESLVGKIVTVEGICTHVCSHGGSKLFIMGSDDTQVIRVQAGKVGSFDADCKNSMLTIVGEVKEDHIDEAYLAAWEAKTKEAEAKKEEEHDHGDGEGHSCSHCSSEKSSASAKSNAVADRIADYRKQISAREKKEGKAYLSYFFVEAKKYEVQ